MRFKYNKEHLDKASMVDDKTKREIIESLIDNCPRGKRDLDCPLRSHTTDNQLLRFKELLKDGGIDSIKLINEAISHHLFCEARSKEPPLFNTDE